MRHSRMGIIFCLTPWSSILTSMLTLHFVDRKLCTARANTSDVPTPQACHIMSSVIRSDLIYVVFSLISAINYELLL